MQDVSLSREIYEIQDDVGQNDDSEAQELVQLCIFELSDRFFGLSIFDVQAIMEDAEITPVPTTPSFLKGVINLRGNIVPIVDIREILHLSNLCQFLD